MADEISVSISLKDLNGNLDLTFEESFTDDQSFTVAGVPGSFSLTTTHEIILSPSSETGIWLGWVYLKNVGSANNVLWGVDDGASNLITVGILAPGQASLFKGSGGTTYRAKSQSATATLLVAGATV